MRAYFIELLSAILFNTGIFDDNKEVKVNLLKPCSNARIVSVEKVIHATAFL